MNRTLIKGNQLRDLARQSMPVLGITAGEAGLQGNVLYYKLPEGKWFKASNDDPAKMDRIWGIARKDFNIDETVIVETTYADVYTGLTDGVPYYVGVNGGITNSKPSSNAKTLGFAVGTTTLVLGDFASLNKQFGSVQVNDFLAIGNNQEAGIMRFGSQGLGFRVGNVDNKVIINDAGRIGIGTLNPATPLHIKEATPYIKLEDTFGGSNETQAIEFATADGIISQIHSYSTGSGVGELRLFSSGGNGLTILANAQVSMQPAIINLPSGATQNAALSFSKAGGYGGTTMYQYYVTWQNYGLRIQGLSCFEINNYNNTIGIGGAASPSYRLNVEGATRLNGNVYMDGGTFYLNASTNNIAINHTSPALKLHIKGAGESVGGMGYPQLLLEDTVSNYPGIVFSGTSGYCGTIRIEGNDGFNFYAYNGGWSSILRVQKNGYTGIGGIAPSYLLHVDASITDFVGKFKNSNSSGAGVNVELNSSSSSRVVFSCSSSVIGFLGGWYANGSVLLPKVFSMTVGANNKDMYIDNWGMVGPKASSIKFKENIRSLDEHSARIYSLNPVLYDYIDKSKGIDCFGLIAEEAFEVLPELVSYDEKNKPDSVVSTRLIPLLLNEVIKLKQEIKLLKGEVA
ncbi:tail fiber domain-containing protein [Candidatus Margulisiibacteriota bacterium]